MKIYDNGGATYDRYTIIGDDGSCFGMSEDPSAPNGFNQYIGDLGDTITEGDHLGTIIPYDRLPEVVQACIEERI